MSLRDSTIPCARPGALTRSTLVSVAAALSLAAAGCVLGPYTGQTSTAQTAGSKVAFNGYSDTAGAPVAVYVLSNASANPLTGLYSWIGGTSTGYTAYNGNDTVPYYTWNVLSASLTAAQWPQGGLARFRVKSKFAGSNIMNDMYTFDNQGMVCLGNNMTDPWRQAGNECRSPYSGGYEGIITMVSTSPTPAEDGLFTIPYLGRGGAHQFVAPPEPSGSATNTEEYYNRIDAPLTLAAFRTKYNFAAGDTQVIYYNKGDLGIARDMHCRKHTPPGKPTVTACYVTNYGRLPTVPFRPLFGSLDPQMVIGEAIAAQSTPTGGNQPVATVAMVYEPSWPQNDNQVQFMVYDQDGDRDVYAALDNAGLEAVGNGVHLATNANITVPDNCLACHGLRATYARFEDGELPSVAGAAFLPFDKEAMIFSTSNSTYSEANMMPRVKTLNAMVYETAPPQAVVDLLNGMYPPNGPTDPGSTFTTSFVPAGWTTSAAATRVYTEVVKPYCRTCHVTATPDRTWSTWAQFSDPAWHNTIKNTVCEGTGPMPNAEQTQTLFWKSPARAHLVNGLGMQTDCAP